MTVAAPPRRQDSSPEVPLPPRGAPWWSVARLVAVLGAISAVFLALGLGPLLVFIAALFVIVILHELGHYLTAKWSRMKVTEFFIGFGPRLWSIRRGETEYGIKPILVGAYVKIPGMTNLEQVDPADEERTYRRQPFRKRILVASAGSLMHGLIAFVLAWVAVVSFGVVAGSRATIAGFTTWKGRAQTAAQAAGLRTGDTILAVGAKKLTTLDQLSPDIQASGGRPVTLTVLRDGRVRHFTVTPQLGYKTASGTEGLGTPTGSEKPAWLVGIETTPTSIFSPVNPLRAVGDAGVLFWRVATAEVTGIAHAFSPSGLHQLYSQVVSPQAASKAARQPGGSTRVTSVVGAARVATQAERAGVYYFLFLLVLLNIALGAINMLPMLPLDGGHVVLALYERIRTRRGRPYYQADARKLLPVAYAFMALLIVIVGSAMFLDIAHPATNPFR